MNSRIATTWRLSTPRALRACGLVCCLLARANPDALILW